MRRADSRINIWILWSSYVFVSQHLNNLNFTHQENTITIISSFESSRSQGAYENDGLRRVLPTLSKWQQQQQQIHQSFVGQIYWSSHYHPSSGCWNQFTGGLPLCISSDNLSTWKKNTKKGTFFYGVWVLRTKKNTDSWHKMTFEKSTNTIPWHIDFLRFTTGCGQWTKGKGSDAQASQN